MQATDESRAHQSRAHDPVLSNDDLRARITTLREEVRELDRIHSQTYRLLAYVDPIRGRRIGRTDGSFVDSPPTTEHCRRMRAAVEVRHLFFAKDAELHELISESTRRALAALPDSDVLKDEIAAAEETLQRTKAAYHTARAEFFRLHAIPENARIRRTELTRSLASAEHEAEKSRAKAERHAGELAAIEKRLGRDAGDSFWDGLARDDSQASEAHDASA